MNNENQTPEIPKLNTEEVKQESILNNVNQQDPVVLQTLPQEVKRESETKQMVKEVKETTSKEVGSTKKFIKDVYKYLTTKNSSELLALLWRLLIIVGIIIVLYVPFYLLIELGSNLSIMFGIDFTAQMLNLWSSILNVLYAILALVLFLVIVKDRYYKLVKTQEAEKKIINENNK